MSGQSVEVVSYRGFTLYVLCVMHMHYASIKGGGGDYYYCIIIVIILLFLHPWLESADPGYRGTNPCHGCNIWLGCNPFPTVYNLQRHQRPVPAYMVWEVKDPLSRRLWLSSSHLIHHMCMWRYRTIA